MPRDMAVDSKLSGWGRTFVPGHEIRDEQLERVSKGAVLSRGLGRSYGDASLPATPEDRVVGTTLADRIVGFDEATGLLTAEAGLSLSELIRIYLPRGFFPPVTPGTRFVTLGGMVASDVHGKNHHLDGSIGKYVRALKLRVADGRVLSISRDVEPELFRATLGGMGLTGHILEVTLELRRVPSPWIYQESWRIAELDDFLAKLKAAGKEWPFTVGWLDTVAMKRSLLIVGRWATPEEAKGYTPTPPKTIAMPFPLPSGCMNRFTIGVFNRLVYHSHFAAHKRAVVTPYKFFHPLDRVLRWNLAYGARGVTQHQCVIPESAGPQGIRALLSVLAEAGASSFLTVVKDCGEEGEGLLSFPRPGMSIALDIPIRSDTQAVVDRLNACVKDVGGRIYLTKDGFTRAEDFRAMEPRLEKFFAVRNAWDPQGQLHSAQSVRLFGDKR
jgi:FAD/FMN-containing dehydrogenase